MNVQTKAICATVGLFGVWGTAEADPTLTLTTNRDLAHATGFFHFNSSVYRDDDSTRTVINVDYGDLAATPDPASPWELPVDDQRGMPLNPRFAYTLMGIYDDEEDGVSVLLESSVATNAITNGLDWDEVFLPTLPNYLNESQMASVLRGDFVPGADVTNFVRLNDTLFPAWNEEATLVHFSAATFGGTGFASASAPVPEPASIAALTLGALALLRRRRAA